MRRELNQAEPARKRLPRAGTCSQKVQTDEAKSGTVETTRGSAESRRKGKRSTPGRSSGSVYAVERAADVLAAVCEDLDRPRGVKELSNALGMNVSTVHRLLASLVNKQILRQDPVSAKYAPGPWLLDLALAYLRRLDLPHVALPFMHRLRDETRETVTLSIRDGMTRIYVTQVESPQEIRQTVETGRRLPLLPGGSGKAILAFLPQTEIDAYLDQYQRDVAAGGQFEPARLRSEFQRARRVGFAYSRSERLSGAASVAAPVRDYRGVVVGSISISGPVQRFDVETIAAYGPMVRDAASEISRALGCPEVVGAPHETEDVA